MDQSRQFLVARCVGEAADRDWGPLVLPGAFTRELCDLNQPLHLLRGYAASQDYYKDQKMHLTLPYLQ